MDSEDCSVGTRARIVMPGNPVLNGEPCKVIGRPAPDEAKVRLDCYKAELEQFEDAKTGTVIVDPADLVAI